MGTTHKIDTAQAMYEVLTGHHPLGWSMPHWNDLDAEVQAAWLVLADSFAPPAEPAPAAADEDDDEGDEEDEDASDDIVPLRVNVRMLSPDDVCDDAPHAPYVVVALNGHEVFVPIQGYGAAYDDAFTEVTGLALVYR